MAPRTKREKRREGARERKAMAMTSYFVLWVRQKDRVQRCTPPAPYLKSLLKEGKGVKEWEFMSSKLSSAMGWSPQVLRQNLTKKCGGVGRSHRHFQSSKLAPQRGRGADHTTPLWVPAPTFP